MRVGQNPAKMVSQVAQPERVTVALITYIPFLAGYYAQSLDVLRSCFESLVKNTKYPHDVMIFDNASCEEVRTFLLEQQAAGNIQYLILSERNIGKAGAWNVIFGGAPGEYVAYADSDVYFFPGWLEAMVAVMDDMPQLGMLTGMPLRSPDEYSGATIAWAETQDDVRLEKGLFLTWDDFWRHARSLGAEENAMRDRYREGEDIRITRNGKTFYVGAGHFQFITRKDVLKQVLPVPSRRPMGEVRLLDIAIDKAGYLRLSMPEWWVQHVGNQLVGLPEDAQSGVDVQTPKRHKANRFLQIGIIQKILWWLYHRIFEILYSEKS